MFQYQKRADNTWRPELNVAYNYNYNSYNSYTYNYNYNYTLL